MVVQTEILIFPRLFNFVEEGESGKFLSRSEKMGLVIGEGSCSSESGLEGVEYSRAGDLFSCFFNDGGMHPPFCQFCDVLKDGLRPFGIECFFLNSWLYSLLFSFKQRGHFPSTFF